MFHSGTIVQYRDGHISGWPTRLCLAAEFPDAEHVGDDAFDGTDGGHFETAAPPGANGEERFGRADRDVCVGFALDPPFPRRMTLVNLFSVTFMPATCRVTENA